MFSERVENLFKKIEGLKECFSDFLAEFPDEAACRAAVISETVAANVFPCSFCSVVNKPEALQDRKFSCKNCKRLIWVTAGTMFEQVEIFQPYLAAFWLMERDIKINPFQFQILANIPSYNTAHKLFKLIALKLTEFLVDDTRLVASAAFVSVYTRRSRETPAGEPPVAEEARARQKADNNTPAKRKKNTQPPGPAVQPQALELGQIEKNVFATMSATPLSFDEIYGKSGISAGELSATLMFLELKGAIKSLPGDRFELSDAHIAKLPVDTAVDDKPARVAVKSIIKFIRALYQGVSRKYLQLYIGFYLFYESIDRWKKGTLLSTFIKSKKTGYDEILKYVTNLQVAINPRESAHVS